MFDLVFIGPRPVQNSELDKFVRRQMLRCYKAICLSDDRVISMQSVTSYGHLCGTVTNRSCFQFRYSRTSPLEVIDVESVRDCKQDSEL